MKGNKRRVKRLLAGVLALSLVFSGNLYGSPLGDWNVLVAEATLGGDEEGHYSEGTRDYDYELQFIPGDNVSVTGYRIMFVPNSVVTTTEHGPVWSKEEYREYFSQYEDYAIYSFGGGMSSSKASTLFNEKSVKNISRNYKYNEGADYTSYHHVFFPGDNRINGGVVLGDGNSIDFSQLLKGSQVQSVETFAGWSFSEHPNFTSASNWAEKYLENLSRGISPSTSRPIDQQAFFNDFISNYKRILDGAYGAGTYDSVGLPRDAMEIYTGFQVVIEPVAVFYAGRSTTGDSDLWIGSAYDYLCPTDSTVYSGDGHSAPEGGKLCANHVGDVFNTMKSAYNTFDGAYLTEWFDTGSGLVQSSRGTNYFEGWGDYTASFSVAAGQTKSNTNIVLYTDEAVKYNSASGETSGVSISGSAKSTILSDTARLHNPTLTGSTLSTELIENTDYNADDIKNSDKFYSYGNKLKPVNPVEIMTGRTDPISGSSAENTFQMATGIAPANSGKGDYTYAGDSDTVDGDVLGDAYILHQYQLYNLTYHPTSVSTDFDKLYNISLDTSEYEVVFEQEVIGDSRGTISSGYVYTPKLRRRDGSSSSLAKLTAATLSHTALGGGELDAKLGTDGDFGKAVYTNISDTNKINNVIGNLTMLGANQSNMKVFYSTANGKGFFTSTDQTQGVSVEFLTKRQNVTTRVASVVRNGTGTELTGHTDVTYDISESGKLTVHTHDLDSDTVGYVVVFPDSAENSGNSLFTSGNDNGQSFANLIRDKELHGDVGLATLQDLITNTAGLRNASVNVVAGGSDYTINMGAFGDTDGNIKGYNVVFIYDTTTPVSIKNSDAFLEAHRLNMIFPSLLGSSLGDSIITVKDSALLDGISVAKNSTYAGTLIGRQSSVKNVLFSDFMDSSGRYWSGGIFMPEWVNPKNFDSSYSHVALTHGLNVSRTLFNDNVVISKLHQDNVDLFNAAPAAKSFLMNNVAPVGLRPTPSSTGIADNTTGYLPVTGYDSFTWSTSGGVSMVDASGRTITVSPYTNGESRASAGYTLNEHGMKYNATTRGTASVSDNLVVNNATRGDSDYTISDIKSINSVMNFYPEVGMLSDIAEIDSEGKLTINPATDKVYVMGEKLRSLKAASMYSMSVDAVDAFDGTVSSSGRATGSAANALSREFGGLPVIYAGSNVTATINVDAKLLFSGFVLDIMDESIDTNVYTGDNTYTVPASSILQGENLRTAWGSDSFDVEANYKSWVDNIKNNLSVGVGYSTYDDSGRYKKTYNCRAQTLRTTGGNTTLECSYNIKVANGSVVKDDTFYALMEQIMYSYNLSNTDEAIAKFNESGIPQAMIDSVESSSDADNNSAVVGSMGRRWYDEEANYFVIRYYKTSDVQLGNRSGTGYSIVCNDKIDVNAGPSQTGRPFDNGYSAIWEVNVFLNKNVNGLNGVIYNGRNADTAVNAHNSTVFMYGMEVDGGEFVIPDATTSNM